MQVVRASNGQWRKGEEYAGIYLRVEDSHGKLWVILDNVSGPKV